MKYAKLAKKMVEIHLNQEFAYKADFITKVIATIIGDMIGPFLALIIYGTTVGIPGWTLNEFLLFQGTIIIVYGLGRTFAARIFWLTYEAVDRGEFDKHLLKPYNSWLYMLSLSPAWEGSVEVLFGVILSAYAMIKLDIAIMSVGFLLYLILIAVGLLFQLTVYTAMSAGTFKVVKNEALVHLYFKFSDFARYPLNVYGFVLQFFLTFLFPIAISSYYPVDVLLRGVSPLGFVTIVAPVIILFGISLWMWHNGIKNYTSAGG